MSLFWAMITYLDYELDYLIIFAKLTWSLFVGKIFAGKSSYDSDSSSLRIAASDKTLVPGSQIDGSSSSTGQIEVPDTVLEDPQVS